MPDGARAGRGGFDPSVPSTARMYDYYLGGKDNYPADREAAQRVIEHWPEVVAAARANRRFLVRAVRFLAERGIDQFIDLGSGIPTSPNVHEVAREVIPDATIVYVDDDPVVAAHSRALRATQGGIMVVESDIAGTAAILADPAVSEGVDLTRPIALLCFASLHFVPVDAGIAALRAWREVAVPGSGLAISTVTTQDAGRTDDVEDTQDVYHASTAPDGLVMRTPGQVADLFAGYDVVEPGIVSGGWRSDDPPLSMKGLAGVGIRRP